MRRPVKAPDYRNEHTRPPVRERILKASEALYSRFGVNVNRHEIAEAAHTNMQTVDRIFQAHEMFMIFLKRCTDFERLIWEDLEEINPNDPYGQILTYVTREVGNREPPDDLTYSITRAIFELPRGHPGRPLIAEHKRGEVARLRQLCADAGFPKPQMLADRLFLLSEGVHMVEVAMGPDGPTKALRPLAIALMQAQKPELRFPE